LKFICRSAAYAIGQRSSIKSGRQVVAIFELAGRAATKFSQWSRGELPGILIPVGLFLARISLAFKRRRLIFEP